MTDEKVIKLPTGYKPDTPPPTQSDVEDIKFQLAVVMDELEILSKRVTQLTKILRDKLRKE